MPKLFHFPWLRRLLNRGVNTDVLPELMPEGTAREAVNVRPGSITGAAGGAEAVKGEGDIPVFPSPGGDGYVLIGSCSCNNRVVEFWASSAFDFATDQNPPLVRVDGTVVAQSRNIPYVYDRPLQLAVVDDFFGTSIAANESPDGVVTGRGIVYPADHNSIPLYWDITQLANFASSGNTSYFGDNYQVGINSVGLFNTPEFPIHTRNVEVGGLGLKTGQYQYALRYVTPQGDRTNIGPWTPTITVPLKQSQRRPWEQSHYPGATTIGGPAGLDTPYGVEIKFRVDNVFGFQKVQVVRRKYNDADNIGQIEMIGELLISVNENSIRTFLDPSDAIAEPEVIPADQEAIKIVAINKPKAVEYSDRRLTYANFETFPKDASNVQFIDRGDGAMFPVTQGVCTRYPSESFDPNGENPREWNEGYYYWNDGYSDPVNNTYLKSYMRGERYGIGVMFWNQYTEQSFVKEVPLSGGSTNDGYLFPNRRDRRTGKSFLYSDGYQGVDPRSLVQATTDLNGTDTGVVGPTFEAFTQGAVAKNWVPAPGNALAPWSGYGFINRVNFSGSSFNPFGPTNPTTNGDESRLSQSPNDKGYATSLGNALIDSYDYTGAVWAARNYALGAAIEGVQNVPSGTTVISVMRTEPARRVVAQGIACWSDLRRQFNNSNTTLKSTNKVDVMIPDFKNSAVSQTIIDLFESNPNSFKIQFVSPLGFFTESYSHAVKDVLSYAGVQWDDSETVNNGLQIDSYQGDPTSGLQPQYVGYGSWRSNAFIGANSWTSSNGNKLFDIENVQGITQNNQTRWRVTLDEDVYQELGGLGNSNSDDVKRFHEPWYVVNIVVDEATISNDQVDKYIETGYHIKTESCIGITPSASQQPGSYQDFPLLNERLGDVYADSTFVQQTNPGNFGDTQFNRYVYIDDGLSVKPWLCVTDNWYANNGFLTILADLTTVGSFTMPDGVTIYGVYSIDNADGWSSTAQATRTGTIRFGQWISSLGQDPVAFDLPMPPDGCRVLVRYNNNEPIRFFGGDCTVSHSLDALFNGNGYYQGQSLEEQELAPNSDLLTLNLFSNPYLGYRKSVGYNMMWIAPASANSFENAFAGEQIDNETIRQWVVYWNAEQRSAIRYYSGSAASQGPYEWPRMGYLMQWSTWFSTTVNLPSTAWPYPQVAIAPSVFIDVNGKTASERGGFLLDCDVNPSYTKQAPITGFGVPFVSSGGSFTEKFYFPTGLIASLEFDQLVQDSPNLRTFLDLNLKTVSEENGEIKTIASALAGGGRNLYAWTDSGVVRILTAKNILTGASGEVISTQAISNYWGEEMWLSRNIGVPDQMWQFFVKGFAPAGDGYADSFFWADRNSIYRMVGDNIMDIGREKFLAYLLPILREYPRGYVPGTSGFYNRKYNEAWMSLNLPTRVPGVNEKNLVVYNPEINAWNGRYTYQFDGYTQNGNTVYGHRNLETYELDQGFIISGGNRVASVTVPMVGDLDSFKEFIRWRVVGTKPDKIQILDPDFVVMCEMPNPLVSPVNPLWVKEYDGWEGWADRTLFSYDPNRKLPQKRYFYLRLVWNTEGDKNATSLSGQLKPIK